MGYCDAFDSSVHVCACLRACARDCSVGSLQWFHTELLLLCLWCIKQHFILPFPHTQTHTHSFTCSLSLWHTASVSSSISTWHPWTVMFSLGADATGYNISQTDGIHSAWCSPPQQNSHQFLAFYSSMSSLIIVFALLLIGSTVLKSVVIGM